jgi:hypothetical protein
VNIVNTVDTNGSTHAGAQQSSTFSFTPLFSVDNTAAPGVYSAQFRLLDLRTNGTPYGASGTFHFDFAVGEEIPEPASLALFGGGAGMIALLGWRRRLSLRRSKAV